MGDRDALMIALAALAEAEELCWHPDGDHYAAVVGGIAYTITFDQWDELTRRGWLRATEDTATVSMAGKSAAAKWLRRRGLKLKGAGT